MTTPTPRRRVSEWVMILTAATIVTAARPAAAHEPLDRVRTDNPIIKAAIGQATSLSATFRRLVEVINNTDGLVYVEEGRCGNRARGCLLHVMTASGPYRMLHIEINTRRAGKEIMGLVGHELQHAVEVLSEPKLNTSVGILNFYQHEGRFSLGNSAETSAALRAGTDVEVEVLQAQKLARKR